MSKRQTLTGWEIDRAGSVLQFSKSDNEWRLVQPWDVRADFGTVEGLVGRIASGRMQSVATEDINAEEDDSGAYGLAAAALTATLGAGSAAATLVVGSLSPRAEYYAQDTSRSIVFTIERSLVTDLGREALEYRRKGPLLVSIVQRNSFGDRAAGNDGCLRGNRPTRPRIPRPPGRRPNPRPARLSVATWTNLLSKISNLRAGFVCRIESRSRDF